MKLVVALALLAAVSVEAGGIPRGSFTIQSRSGRYVTITPHQPIERTMLLSNALRLWERMERFRLNREVRKFRQQWPLPTAARKTP